MSTSLVQSTQKRIRPIDAARGAAMLFVFFSHFVEVFFKRYGVPVQLAYAVTQIASPAFIVISGVMLGILFTTRREKYPATRSSFIRRGIFLLTVGKALIFLAHIPMAGGWQEALRWGFMTDAIGVCIIIGPILMDRIGLYGRVLLGCMIYLGSWTLAIWWIPGETPAMIIKETLFGSFGHMGRYFTDVFPILPWLGLYLAATSLGEVWGGIINTGRQGSLEWMALRIGLFGVLSATCFFAFRTLLEHMVDLSMQPDVHMILSPQQKVPPGPVYFLFYGGWAFLLLFALLRYRDVRIVEKCSAAVEVLGRNSLFAFIVQYFVYFSLIPVITFPSAAIWPVLFAISALAIWGIVHLWDKGKMNRFLTIPQHLPGFTPTWDHQR